MVAEAPARKPLPLKTTGVAVATTTDDGATLVMTGGGAVAEVTVNALLASPNADQLGRFSVGE
jgi:hypothetical protein